MFQFARSSFGVLMGARTVCKRQHRWRPSCSVDIASLSQQLSPYTARQVQSLPSGDRRVNSTTPYMPSPHALEKGILNIPAGQGGYWPSDSYIRKCPIAVNAAHPVWLRKSVK